MGEITLTCRNCGRPFAFSEGEQAFYLERGYRPPSRCPDCRDARRAMATPDAIEPSAVRCLMFEAICSSCGEPTSVPFEPEPDRPVYCQSCYARRRTAH